MISSASFRLDESGRAGVQHVLKRNGNDQTAYIDATYSLRLAADFYNHSIV